MIILTPALLCLAVVSWSDGGNWSDQRKPHREEVNCSPWGSNRGSSYFGATTSTAAPLCRPTPYWSLLSRLRNWITLLWTHVQQWMWILQRLCLCLCCLTSMHLALVRPVCQIVIIPSGLWHQPRGAATALNHIWGVGGGILQKVEICCCGGKAKDLRGPFVLRKEDAVTPLTARGCSFSAPRKSQSASWSGSVREHLCLHGAAGAKAHLAGCK